MGTQLDLHRLTVEEALPRIDQFLSDIYTSGLHHALIIHGKGTGVLRQEVNRYLAGHPLVKAYRPADRFSGGFGATEVELK